MAAPHHHLPHSPLSSTLHSSCACPSPSSSTSSSSAKSMTKPSSVHTPTDSTSSTSSFSLLDSASSYVFLNMADTDLDLSFSIPQNQLYQQQQQQQQEQQNVEEEQQNVEEEQHSTHSQAQSSPSPDDDHALSLTSISQESLVNVSFPLPDKSMVQSGDDTLTTVTVALEVLVDQPERERIDDSYTQADAMSTYHNVQAQDGQDGLDRQEKCVDPHLLEEKGREEAQEPRDNIAREVDSQEQQQLPLLPSTLSSSNVVLTSTLSPSLPPVTLSPSSVAREQLLPPLHIDDHSSSSFSSSAPPTSSTHSPIRSASSHQRPQQHIPHKITIPSQQHQHQHSLPPSAAVTSPFHSNHNFSNKTSRHSQMGVSPSSSSSSIDVTSLPPSPSDHHNQRIRHVSSSNRLSRTPKRESSLPFPMPTVLPALPPLIPVSKAISPTSPNGSRTPLPATPVTPTAVSTPTSATASITERPSSDSHSRATMTRSDIKSVPAVGSRLVSSGGLASTWRGDTEKVPIGEPNSEPTTAHDAATPNQRQQHTTSDNDTLKTNVTGYNILHHHSKNHAEKDADSNAEYTDESSTWPEHPRQFLERIKETVSKAELGTLLSKGSDPFHQAVLRIHMESFDFRRDPIDLALRKFLLDFHFPKEAQQIDRVLEAFAGQYHACNSHLFRSSEVVYTVAFSLMLLHTDAHNKNVRYKMSKEQYVRQAKSIDGVNTIPADILEVLYDNITYLKFVYAEDELDVDGQRIAEVQPTTGSWFPRRRTASNQRTDSYNMIRHGSIAHLAPDLSDLIPFRWPYYWKGTIEMVDNVQINNQFTRAPLMYIPGLRTRGHGQIPPHELLHAGTVKNSNRSDTTHYMDSEREHTADAARRYNDNVIVSQDSCAELKIVKFGILSRKIDIENGKKSAVRGWRDLGVILSGSQLLFFTDTTWFQQQRASNVGFNPHDPPEEDGFFASEVSGGSPPMPQALISTLDSIAVIDSSYQKYPHVFRLVCPNGKQYLFRADSEHEMNDWMAKINYASAFKTAGVRLRNYRVAWAEDVFWTKDEQGRHQLRRHQKTGTACRPEPLDGRSQLIQAKMKDIDRQINACSASLAAELRLARGLEVMIPLQSTTRQKIVQSATVVGKRLRQLMLERTKLDCFRTVLERDLAVIPAERLMSGARKNYHQGLGVDLHGDESLSGTTDYSHTSLDSGTLRSGTDGLGQVPDDLEYLENLQQHPSLPPEQLPRMSHRSSLSMNEHLDHIKDEYVLDPSKNQCSNRSTKGPLRPRLQVPEFQRTMSENALDDGRRTLSTNNTDIPIGPVAIQAAIIDAARGTQGTIPGTLSSPNPNHYQSSGNPTTMSQQDSGIPNSLAATPTLLTPETPFGRSNTRSRALSVPGQRPSIMPRTVSIYSSSSQTANRLKQIFEQGLGHFKWGSSNQSAPGSSLKFGSLFPANVNASDPAFVHDSSSPS